ncbi:MAG TPA: extracellular solute-binding protein [Kiloniellaceae bacterium]|nr:extracellular solute-binding protein [Kiloniellaceae bacterium]
MAMKKLLSTVTCAAVLSLAAAPGAQAAGELFLYNWSNYFPPDLLTKFEQDTGIKVTLDVYDSNETMLAKLQAGAAGYDVVVPSDYMVKIMIEEGLAEKIDAGQMENFKNVMAPHDKQSFDPEREYSAPYMWGTTGFTYDSAKVGELEESWKEVFEPKDALKGQIAMLNDEVEVYNAAAYYTGVDKCTEDTKEAQKILNVLEAQKPHVATYNSDGTIDRLAAGEVLAHMQWNGASHRTKETLPTAVYMYPKEGISFWADNFVVPTSAPNKENAKIFVNWMMAPENAAIASNFTGYMNAVRGSDAFMDESLKNDPAVAMPEEYADRLRPNLNCSAAARELRNKVWTRLKS